jgi:hypothetical protein
MVPFLVRHWTKLIVLCVPLAAAHAEEGGPSLDRLTGLEFGGRYWYSTGRIGFNYYGDATSAFLVSRLNYDGLTANSGEAYFRGDIAWGFFVKGTIGAGNIGSGRLFDEDFPPGIDPYSKTSSDTSGSLSFGNVDVGYSFIHAPRGRLGAFVGYGRWREVVDARGCRQLAGNPEVCVPALPSSLPVIQEADTWNLLRAGLVADVMLTDRLKLSGEAAYIRASQKAVDDHYFTFGVDPASGSGNGYQLETILAYQFNEAFNVGVGGRWWHLDTKSIDSFDQLLAYDVNRYGVFIQAGLKLN